MRVHESLMRVGSRATWPWLLLKAGGFHCSRFARAGGVGFENLLTRVRRASKTMNASPARTKRTFEWKTALNQLSRHYHIYCKFKLQRRWNTCQKLYFVNLELI